MHRQNELGRPRTGTVLASLALGSCLLALAACGGGDDAPPTPTMAAVPTAAGSVAVETGGMALPGSGSEDAQPESTTEAAGAASGDGAAAAPTADAASTESSPATDDSGAGQDQGVSAGTASASTEGESAGEQPASEASSASSLAPVLVVGSTITADGPVTLHADAGRTSPRFGVYDAGTVLTVIEAAGDYTAYPVEVDGARWYRVRAPDGLVGWMEE